MAGNAGGYRLQAGGLVARDAPLRFRFDGRDMTGFAGDTLASALLANGVRVLARSFKYHRPRGIYAAGVEDPSAMLAVTDAFGTEPALRAGQVRLVEGIDARPVSGWPSVEFDVGALAQAAAPFLKAGFYYKTFMWPNWHWFEPAIRRATGYGRPENAPSRRTRARRHDVCDVLVVGGGIAGIAAARELAARGRDVIVVDDGPDLGGAARWEPGVVEGAAGPAWARTAATDLASAGVRVLVDTTVTGAYEGNFFTLLETLRDPGGVAGERIWNLRAHHVVLATGAVGRPLAFPDNDRPGIMLATAARRFVGEYAAAPASRVAVYAGDDSGYRTATALRAAGIEVAAVIDPRDGADAAWAEGLRDLDIPYHPGAEIVATRGYRGLREIRVRSRSGGAAMPVACGALAVAGGWTPLIHLAAQRGTKPRYDAEADAFVCAELPGGWQAAGAVAGACDAEAALAEGAAAADAILSGARGSVGRPRKAAPSIPENAAANSVPSRVWIDLQNDVTGADIDLAAAEGYVSVEHLKRYTTLGMGTDQGRTSNVNGLARLARRTGSEIGALGTTTFRPPFVGVRMGAVAHVHQDALYRPRRRMPAHEVHVAHGGQFVDFGWERPDWYAANGGDREAAVAAEMAAVRDGVGVFDASPLGKIEVAGPDAATFLNRFYVSNLLTLKPGRVRYSVMLADDGIIFDDGVVTRVDETLYIAGPTSAHADAVAAWFERWRQTEWPDLRVAVAPVTSAWACFALAGPGARALLDGLDPDFETDAGAFPHMSFREGTVGGVPARVARVSFTGELQYEVSVPSRFGPALLRRLLDLGTDAGVRLVGMEAWLRLRLEKGYLHVGTDTDGRTTPGDIGMGTIVARKPDDFIGRRALGLAFPSSPAREELVGLVASTGALRPGGRILADNAAGAPGVTEGYVTSACFSPSVGAYIGLALLRRGRARLGERIRVYDDGRIVAAEVRMPPFLDPENERLSA